MSRAWPFCLPCAKSSHWRRASARRLLFVGRLCRARSGKGGEPADNPARPPPARPPITRRAQPEPEVPIWVTAGLVIGSGCAAHGSGWRFGRGATPRRGALTFSSASSISICSSICGSYTVSWLARIDVAIEALTVEICRRRCRVGPITCAAHQPSIVTHPERTARKAIRR
jgi:hypothetical protein